MVYSAEFDTSFTSSGSLHSGTSVLLCSTPGSTRHLRSGLWKTSFRWKTKQKPAAPKPPVKNGDVLGRMDIPRLECRSQFSKDKLSNLRLGVGHIKGTALSRGYWEQRDCRTSRHLLPALKDVRRNDEIEIQTASGRFRYQVDWVKVVAPNDTSVLTPSTESALTLVTCYPFYYVGPSPNRFVVRAHKY